MVDLEGSTLLSVAAIVVYLEGSTLSSTVIVDDLEGSTVNSFEWHIILNDRAS